MGKIKNKLVSSKIFFFFKIFIFWKILIYAFSLIAPGIFSLQETFLGGGAENYLKNPLIWPFVNFDGEHFLSIATNGYQPLTYFYFPAYPLLVRSIAGLISTDLTGLALTGLVVSHIFFFLSILIFYKLVRLDFDDKIAKLSALALIFFPTSFYFGSFYSESMFLFLTLLAFYLIRKNFWITSGLTFSLANLTRFVGISAIPAFFAEFLIENKRRVKFNIIRPVVGMCLAGVGIFAYSFFLFFTTGDPLNYFTNVAIFGDQRSSSIIFFPQVFYRYFFKILPNINYNYFPVVFTTYLEIVTALLFLVLIFYSIKRLRASYSVYLISSFLIPSFSGSFSSFPRYALTAFPAFILIGIFLSKLKVSSRLIYFAINIAVLTVSVMLFTRGYWVS